MNWDKMKNNVGYHVQLVPIACRLDEHGGELPQKDDDWIIEKVSDAGVRISNARTNHFTTLGKDHSTTSLSIRKVSCSLRGIGFSPLLTIARANISGGISRLSEKSIS